MIVEGDIQVETEQSVLFVRQLVRGVIWMKSKWKLPFPILVVFLLWIDLSLSNSYASAEAASRPERDPHRSPAGAPLDAEAGAPSAPSVVYGSPGVTYRFLNRYGSAREAYPEDGAHFVRPFAVSSVDDRIWIADSEGNRALNFDSSGALVGQIGKAGFREHYRDFGVPLEWISDVAEDPAGRIWIVDGGAHHVAVFDDAGSFLFQIGEPWVSGSDNQHFDRPQGIAFDSAGSAFIADANNHRIQVFDADGNYLNTLGAPGQADGEFSLPGHLAIDFENRLYVADTDNHRVQVFDAGDPLSITFVEYLGATGECTGADDRLCLPTGVDVDANSIYIADTGNTRVVVYDRATSAFSRVIGPGAGSGAGEFLEPTDVAIDSAGNLYVADPPNQRVQMFDSSGSYARTYGTTGEPYAAAEGYLNSPAGTAVSADGSIYLTEGRGQRLLKLTPQGALSWSVGEAGVAGEDDLHLNNPRQVAIDSQNRAYVADSANHRIQIYDSSGLHLGKIGAVRGAADDQFDLPTGVAAAPNGSILVADYNNHRVQVFNGSYEHIRTLGQTGTPGSGPTEFNHPLDVCVDQFGNMYVLDQTNERIQVFGSDYSYLRTIGAPGGTNFGYLRNPTALAVDPLTRRIFVASARGAYVDVFDPNGAFLTRINSSYTGSLVGQFLQVDGLAVDSSGRLYAADRLNHVLELWAPGVPYFGQMNISGYGDSRTWGAWSLADLGDRLYVGTYGSPNQGASIRRLSNGIWETVASGGFGNPANFAVEAFAQFGQHLYAAVGNAPAGGEIWRSPSGNSGSWTRVVSGGFDSPLNGEIVRLIVFGENLYAATWSWDTAIHGAQIWRSPSGDENTWTRVLDDAVTGESENEAVVSLVEFGGRLYAGTWNRATGGELWSTIDGTEWSQAHTDGFGVPENSAVISLAVHDEYLYAAFRNTASGGQIWRSLDGESWSPVITDGFGDAANTRPQLIVFKGRLYAVTGNLESGSQIWRTSSGDPDAWELLMSGGFGQGVAAENWYDWSLAVVKDNLYIGTSSPGNGGARIWLYSDHSGYLPLIRR